MLSPPLFGLTPPPPQRILEAELSMTKQPNLLACVRSHLMGRGEDYRWVTMGPEGEKIGLAYLPAQATPIPCPFMFTELREPASLVFDAHFAHRIAPADQAELSMLFLTLNANLAEGQLLLDAPTGLVYYRLKFVLGTPAPTEEEILGRIAHMEAVGLSMANTYARIIAAEFPEQ